jgi:hypothetical protein
MWGVVICCGAQKEKVDPNRNKTNSGGKYTQRWFAEIYDQERDSSAVFQEMPFHYIEVAHLLVRHAKDCFEDLYRVDPPPPSTHTHTQKPIHQY